MSHAIEIDKVSKTFRPARGIGKWLSASPISHPIHALKEVTLAVGEGEIFGLLGPNGAGKTTLLKILATLIRPGRGEARVAGYDVVRDEESVKERLGFVYTNERIFYWRLSGRENLRFFGSLMNIRGEGVKLDFEIEEPAKNLSGIFDLFYEKHVAITHLEALESGLNAIFEGATRREAG